MVPIDARLRRSDQVVYHSLEEGGVLLDLRSGRYYGLDPVGAVIWALLEEEMTVAALVRAIHARIVTTPREMGGEVAAFVAQLHTRELMEVAVA